MIQILVGVLALCIVTAVILVLMGEPENSLIGLNIATVAAVTFLLVLDRHYGLAFSKDIGLYLILPGVLGVMVFSRFLLEVKK
jgi:multisubunit Na+/H+ antiporter MnhF subunit